MLDGQGINHICCHSSAVRIVIGIAKEIALDRHVGEERLCEMSQDWHETVVLVHPWK